MAELNGLGQVALPVKDLDASEAFYGDLLGLTRLFRFDNLSFLDCGGVRLMLEVAVAVKPCDGVCHYFKTADIEAAHIELQAQGASFEQSPHLIATMPDHELWMAFFHDPDGHLLALMEERPHG